jgi:hypothetical protein
MKNKYNLLLLSIADAFFLSVFLRLLFALGNSLLKDADTGYHIRAGEFILNTLSVPKKDVFSYTSPSLPWTAHEWFSEVIMALVYKGFGLTGIVIFFSFLIAVVYSVLFRTIRTDKGNIIFATLLIFLVVPSSQLHWLARPHIFSLLLTVTWYRLLDSYQYKKGNYLYALPPLMFLWVNLHGGFMFGFILLAVYLVGNAIPLVFMLDHEKKQEIAKIKFLALTGVACLITAVINPYGYRILLFPLQLTSDKFLMDNISEYLSPNFHGWVPFRYLLFLTIAIFGISKARLNLIELILIVGLTHMALYSARYIPLFAIIAAPILLRQAESVLNSGHGTWIDFFKRRSRGIARIDASSKGHIWPILTVLMVCFFVAMGKIEYKFDEKLKPVRAVEFLKKEDLKGNMFNNDEFGDYIIYAAWPKYKVFIDGRLDMYGSKRIREYIQVANVQPGWEGVIQKYDIRWIIYNANSSLSLFLMQSDDWHLIYADKVAAIFVKNIPENQHIIDKYADVKLVTKGREDSSP